jgi:hypothetical protein
VRVYRKDTQSCGRLPCGGWSVGALAACLPQMPRAPLMLKPGPSCVGPNWVIQASIGMADYCWCRRAGQADRSLWGLTFQEIIAKHGFQAQKWGARWSLHTSSWAENSAYTALRLLVMPVYHPRFHDEAGSTSCASRASHIS